MRRVSGAGRYVLARDGGLHVVGPVLRHVGFRVCLGIDGARREVVTEDDEVCCHLGRRDSEQPIDGSEVLRRADVGLGLLIFERGVLDAECLHAC